MSHENNRRPVDGRTATAGGAKNFSDPKRSWPLGRLLLFLWMQNTIVLVCTVVAILAVTA